MFSAHQLECGALPHELNVTKGVTTKRRGSTLLFNRYDHAEVSMKSGM